MYILQLLSEEGPNTELVGLLWGVLIFFFLMVLIGWWASKNKKPEPEVVQASHGHAEEHHAEPKRVDDLEVIEGIGPKVARVLKESGIASFDDLAHANAAKVNEVLKAAGLSMMNAEGWIEQAKLAAKGDMEGMKKMQAEMKGGRLK
jgi:large subunit ribosomal protein L17